MYDLKVDGKAAFKNSKVLSRRSYYTQSLIGTVDGSNKVFSGQFYPWDSNRTPTIYLDAVAQATSSYTINYPAGKVTFTTAPALGKLVTADYTYIEADDTDLLDILKEGFDEMVERLGLSDNWTLSDNGTNVYIVDDDGVDPSVNDTYFSTERAAKLAYILCCQYVYLRQKAQYTAVHNRSVRSGDVSVNPTKQASDIRELLAMLEKDMLSALSELTLADLPDGQYGQYIGAPKSEEYKHWFEWQGNADESVDGSVFDT